MDNPSRSTPKPSKQGQPEAKEGDRPLPAGPHSKPELTNKEATPGTGMLPDDPEDEHMQPSG